MIEDLLEQRPDAPADTAADTAEYDVCVIGAGAAGITLAVDLVRRGLRVLLLEAGGRLVEPDAQDPYASEVVGPAPHFGIHEGRVRALGGTTTKWGGQILEFTDLDFGERPWVPGSGWPITRDELAPYYRRAMTAEGLDGVLHDDAQVWERLGLPAPQLGTGLEQYFTRWCPEPDFARLNHDVLESSDRLRVVLHSSAVEFGLDGDRARTVRCRSTAGHDVRFTAASFVVAMGTIETNRFFLQPAAHGRTPWADNAHLGVHYQDHIDADVATVRPLDRPRFDAIFDNVYLDGYKYHPKFRLDDAAQGDGSTLTVAGTMRFTSSADEELAELRAAARRVLRSRGRAATPADVRRAVAHLPLIARQAWRYTRAHRAYNPPDSVINLRVHCEQEPAGPNRITLSDQRDALGMLRTRLDWRVTDHELASITTFAETTRAALQDRGLAEVELFDGLGDDEFRKQCADGYHHMSGMRMSTGRDDGVVDTDLRVHGTANVYVCSAAVFPTSGFSNPTHTLLALALRLAEHLDPRSGRAAA